MSGASRRIGVVGGYGAVGRAAVRVLRDSNRAALRVGGRDGTRAGQLVSEELHGAGEAMAVDAYDEGSLTRFCTGCDVVMHTGGASYQVQDRVAVAALAAGADYVDSGGDLPLYRQLSRLQQAAPGWRALVTAGMMPGLSGLLPRWLAGVSCLVVDRLTVHVGVVDRLSPAGAIDYLLSMGARERESRAAWIGGRRVARALTPLTDAVLPFFPGRVAVFPYLGYEAERLAEQLSVQELRWYSVFDQGGNMMAALSRLQGAMLGDADLAAAGGELEAAAELDLFGRRPYQLMVYEMTGADQVSGQPRTSTLMVRSDSTSALTGTVCALAALALLDRAVRPGVHFAAEGLPAGPLVSSLRATTAVRAFELLDEGGAQAARRGEPMAEGAL
jgi:hypothetical protein